MARCAGAPDIGFLGFIGGRASFSSCLADEAEESPMWRDAQARPT